LTSADYFAGQRVVLFALPGAFTPTCSSTHLPGYETHYDAIRALGIDEIYCLSVNDAFVMRQWGLQQGLAEDKTIGSLGFQKVKLIPDGAAAFTRGMGMSTLWDEQRGFGERSWRYSMVVNDRKIEKLFIEQPKVQNSEADPFEVSDADTYVCIFVDDIRMDVLDRRPIACRHCVALVGRHYGAGLFLSLTHTNTCFFFTCSIIDSMLAYLKEVSAAKQKNKDEL
jgi:thioredoxin-dependent peroxiredoxin